MQRLTISLRLQAGRIAPSIAAGEGLPLAPMVAGRTPEAVAVLLPRLFGLCRAAQGAAARLALGLAPTTEPGALAREVLREHLVVLFATLTPLVGLTQPPFSLADPGLAMFGAARALPRRRDDLAAWLCGGQGLAPLVGALAARFRSGEAVTRPLAVPDAGNALALAAVENSPAGRQLGHPLLGAVEAEAGRGPLWRLMGMLADAEAAQAGHLPPPGLLAGGVAVVAAARGRYALRLPQAAGLVSGIERVTPTDQIAAPGGALMQALANLPADRLADAALVVALHDPCLPVDLREVR